MNKLLREFPGLILLIGLFVAANNYFMWFPAQVLTGNLYYIVPGIMFIMGGLGMFMKRRR